MTAAIGAVSLLSFAVFLYAGPFDLVDLGLGEPGRLMFDALLSAVFFLQHSLMVRKSFRRRLDDFVAPHHQAALYTVASGLALLGCMALWQGSDILLLEAHGLPLVFLRAAYLLSLLGFYWGIRALGSVDMLGLAPILRNLQGKQPPPPKPFVVRGPYRWVRHPLYLCSIVLFWSNPVLTLDRLLFNILWTTWIVIGAVLEERDLIADFGAAYRDYQKGVPMFIPRSLRPADAKTER